MRDKLKQDYDHEYYRNNKEQLKMRAKKYYQKNLAKFREKIKCLNCGAIYTINSKYKHFQSKKHLKSLQNSLIEQIIKFEQEEDNNIDDLMN